MAQIQYEFNIIKSAFEKDLRVVFNLKRDKYDFSYHFIPVGKEIFCTQCTSSTNDELHLGGTTFSYDENTFAEHFKKHRVTSVKVYPKDWEDYQNKPLHQEEIIYLTNKLDGIVTVEYIPSPSQPKENGEKNQKSSKDRMAELAKFIKDEA